MRFVIGDWDIDSRSGQRAVVVSIGMRFNLVRMMNHKLRRNEHNNEEESNRKCYDILCQFPH